MNKILNKSRNLGMNLLVKGIVFTVLGFTTMTPFIMRIFNYIPDTTVGGFQLSSLVMFYAIFLRGSLKRLTRNLLLLLVIALVVYGLFYAGLIPTARIMSFFTK